MYPDLHETNGGRCIASGQVLEISPDPAPLSWQTAFMAALPDELLGAWRLVEFADRPAETDEWRPTLGAGASGLFMCDSGGAFSLQIYAPNGEHRYLGYFGQAWITGLSRGYAEVTGSLHVNRHGGYPDAVLDEPEARPFTLIDDILVLGDRRTWKRTLVRIS